jgi:predicted methyltransferase
MIPTPGARPRRAVSPRRASDLAPLRRGNPEAERDRNDEARSVMSQAGVVPGMTVADIGAGEGYYTVRLAAQVGKKGRVLAEDIDPVSLSSLGDRVARKSRQCVDPARGGGGSAFAP